MNKIQQDSTAGNNQLLPQEVVLSLSGEIAHELRTPLATIHLYTELLEETLASHHFAQQETHQAEVKEMEDYSKVIKQIIRETDDFIDSFLLQIRYVSTGSSAASDDKQQGKYKRQRYSMQRTLQKVLKYYPWKPQQRAGVQLAVDQNFYYQGEKVLVEHVLNNLIKNALAALHEQTDTAMQLGTEVENKPPRIWISCTTDTVGAAESAQRYGIVTVTDNAGLLGPEMLQQLFNQFTGRNISYKNGGIGLNFCRLVMHNLGGEISCDAQPGQYTRFILRFPLAITRSPNSK